MTNDLQKTAVPDQKQFYGLQNDYMFHAVMQESELVLKHLTAALLDIPVTDITECTVQNPLIYGEAIGDKTCILDVRLLLNKAKRIDLELQTSYQEFWPDRSLLYWSRTFDHLHAGEDYSSLLPAYHIGILGFTIFKEYPEFYSEYRVLNVRNHHMYSDKFGILVLDLTRTDLAADTVTEQTLVKWADVLKAQTLAELETLSNGNEVFENMTTTVKRLNNDERVREACEQRVLYDWSMTQQYNGVFKKGFNAAKSEDSAQVEEANRRADAADKRADTEAKRADAAEQELRRLKERLAKYEPVD